MGKSWPHGAASSYLYFFFLCANLCILFILFFKLSFCNRAETELNCKTGIREPVYKWHFLSHADSWWLVPFSSKSYILQLFTLSVSLFWLQNQELCHIPVTKWRSSLQRGTQQENSATKHAVIIGSSCYSSAWQSEWGFVLECVDWSA
jgi:hypothetical protein